MSEDSLNDSVRSINEDQFDSVNEDILTKKPKMQEEILADPAKLNLETSCLGNPSAVTSHSNQTLKKPIYVLLNKNIATATQQRHLDTAGPNNLKVFKE